MVKRPPSVRGIEELAFEAALKSMVPAGEIPFAARHNASQGLIHVVCTSGMKYDFRVDEVKLRALGGPGRRNDPLQDEPLDSDTWFGRVEPEPDTDPPKFTIRELEPRRMGMGEEITERMMRDAMRKAEQQQWYTDQQPRDVIEGKLPMPKLPAPGKGGGEGEGDQDASEQQQQGDGGKSEDDECERDPSPLQKWLMAEARLDEWNIARRKGKLDDVPCDCRGECNRPHEDGHLHCKKMAVVRIKEIFLIDNGRTRIGNGTGLCSECASLVLERYSEGEVAALDRYLDWNPNE